MVSKWLHKKGDACRMRKKGHSVRDIEKSTGVPRSTLSGWFRNITLTDTQKNILKRRHAIALQHARSKASTWHKKQKMLRHLEARRSARDIMMNVNLRDVRILKITLAALYMGEGAKRDGDLVLASSNPTIVKFYINALHRAYNIQRNRLKIELHIRADQHGDALMESWLKMLRLPKTARGSIQMDARTKLKPTREGYMGVCLVSGGGSAAQRELVYLGNALFEHFGK